MSCPEDQRAKAARRKRAEAFLMKDASPAARRVYAAGKKLKRESDRKAWWNEHGGAR